MNRQITDLALAGKCEGLGATGWVGSGLTAMAVPLQLIHPHRVAFFPPSAE